MLNNDNGTIPSEQHPPAKEDLPINIDPPTREETAEAIAAMKRNKATALNCAITADALQGGGDQMLHVLRSLYLIISTPSVDYQSYHYVTQER